MSFRAEKLASTIKKLLAQEITDVAKEISAGFATLTSVRLTKDLQTARIYLSLYGKNSKPGDLIEELENRKHHLRHILAKELHVRFIPDLHFYIDDTLNQMEKIKSILESIKSDDKENNKNV